MPGNYCYSRWLWRLVFLNPIKQNTSTKWPCWQQAFSIAILFPLSKHFPASAASLEDMGQQRSYGPSLLRPLFRENLSIGNRILGESPLALEASRRQIPGIRRIDQIVKIDPDPS